MLKRFNTERKVLKKVIRVLLTLASTSKLIKIAVQWLKASLLPLIVGLQAWPWI